MLNNILTIEDISEVIQKIAKKYNLKRVSLFGSYARGEATEESDIDLYIIDSPNSYAGMSWGVFSMIEELEKTLNKRVDVIFPRQIKKSWDMLGTRLLYKNIKDDEVVLYEWRALQRYSSIGAYGKVL